MMQVFTTISATRDYRATLGPLALVPTMGALHAGHLSLVTEAHRQASAVAVSIFVNPTQFGPNEDFSRYPRPMEQDLEMCRQAGVDFVFHPAPAEMYRPGLPEIRVDLPGLTTVLEGAHRPGHFSGVCQVVAKLFNIVRPDVACFGRKDFQQLRVLSAMVEALDWPIEMIACPILRDPDGLAMSSRNRYLSADERRRALTINQAIFAAEKSVRLGHRDAAGLIESVREQLLASGLAIDYVAIVDALTLEPQNHLTVPAVLAIAVRVGTTRLIDNITLLPPLS